MTDLFGSTDPQADFSSIYTDDSAAKAPDPSQSLFDSLSSAAKAASAAVPAASGAASTPAPAPAPASPASTAAAPAGSAPAAPQQSPDQSAMLARLAPKGITSLDQLKGKTDVELHKLSQDVVAYEMRQKSLDQFFRKNPDGTYDLTQGPDGSLTGLDPAGKVIPPGGAAPAMPAAPATPAKPPLSKARMKPGAKKRAAKPAPRRAASRKVTLAKKPVARKPAPKSTLRVAAAAKSNTRQ